MLRDLNEIQINVLIASIIGDGELTKLYKGSRRKNSSYREHYSEKQKEYREWKAQLMDGLFYITPKSHSLRSSSMPLFTDLLKLFYNNIGKKILPHSLLPNCKLPHFLAVLYMDDGSLSISNSINHNNKKIYLTPHIFLYLQNYTSEDLSLLKDYLKETFNINIKLANRKDGYGTILRTTSVKETFYFLNTIKEVTLSCESMFYKTNWEFRFQKEEKKWKTKYPNYKILVTSSDRKKNYSNEEIEKIISLKKNGSTDQDIAKSLGRTYWSVVYKLGELRKLDLL